MGKIVWFSGILRKTWKCGESSEKLSRKIANVTTKIQQQHDSDIHDIFCKFHQFDRFIGKLTFFSISNNALKSK